MHDILPLLHDAITLARAGRDRGYQFRMEQTPTSLTVNLWWDPAAIPTVVPDQGLVEAFRTNLHQQEVGDHD